MRTQFAAFVALGLAAGAAYAEDPAGFVDIYYVPVADIQARSVLGHDNDHGDGFGAKGMFKATEGVTVTGEYQAIGYQDFDDLTQYRLGAGLTGESGGGLFAEYIVTDDALEADGYGAHLRFVGSFFYGQIGYLWLDSDDLENTLHGWEFTVGAVIPMGERLSGFVDIRRTGLGRDGSEFETDTSDLRAGVRIAFGGAPAAPAESE